VVRPRGAKVYLRDLTTTGTRLVSEGDYYVPGGRDAATVSADGRRVVYIVPVGFYQGPSPVRCSCVTCPASGRSGHRRPEGRSHAEPDAQRLRPVPGVRRHDRRPDFAGHVRCVPVRHLDRVFILVSVPPI